MRKKAFISILTVISGGIVLAATLWFAVRTAVTRNAPDITVFFILMTAIAILSGVIYALAGAHIKKRVASSITDILNTLDEISAGNLGVTVDVKAGGEFGRLGLGINNMLGSINARMAEVAEMTDDLRHLGAIVAVADAGIIVKDKDGIVQKWNIGAETLIGYKEDEIVGKSTKHYAPAFAHDGIDEIERKLKKGEHIAHLEVVRQRKNGQLID